MIEQFFHQQRIRVLMNEWLEWGPCRWPNFWREARTPTLPRRVQDKTNPVFYIIIIIGVKDGAHAQLSKTHEAHSAILVDTSRPPGGGEWKHALQN